MPAKKPNKTSKPNNSLDVYKNHHQWDTTTSRRMLDPSKVDYYINNDLDLNELYDELKIPSYSNPNNKKYIKYGDKGM